MELMGDEDYGFDYEEEMYRDWDERIKIAKRKWPIKKRLIYFIQMKLEQACSRQVGNFWRTKGKCKTAWWFSAASKMEFFMRKYL